MKKLLVIIALFLSFNAIGQKEKVQCLGITKSGVRCARMLDSTSYCWQHVTKHDNTTKDSTGNVYIPKFKAGILEMNTDNRGLISVVYVDKAGDKWALDYITKKQLNKLIAQLK